ncbi:hypothetical protein [Halopenitus persicus]|uniref:hypothetical protein n=1 Tax=Halopenitus persicus TaxID=1048396 RepID=UPI001E536E7B|nr:hypothetical protein [Halopenitus persicus]
MNDDIRDQLVDAERTFEGSPGTIEEGLDVDDAELVQLRRACRLLDVGANLLEQGYYTVVIESAFVAIERTIQFRLIYDGAMSPRRSSVATDGSTSVAPRSASMTTRSGTTSPSCGPGTERRPTTGLASQRRSKLRRCTSLPTTSTGTSSI